MLDISTYMYYNIIKLRDNISKEDKGMTRITINNGTVTKESALKDAREINDQTGEAVEVCNMLGDTVAYITSKGRMITY